MRGSCASSQRINEFPSRLSVVRCRKLSCSYAAWSILSEQTSRERLELAAPASSTGKVALVRENGAITPSTFAAASGRSNRTSGPTRGEQLTARNTESGGTAAHCIASAHSLKYLKNMVYLGCVVLSEMSRDFFSICLCFVLLLQLQQEGA